MKPSWGVGSIVAILLSIAAALLGAVRAKGLLSLALLLVGAWTLLSAFVIVDREDRTFYAGWGIVLAGLAFSYVLPLRFALGLVLIALVVLILATVSFGRTPKMSAAAAPPPSAAGETPAATAI
ncbi:MAG: hypothetical protein JRN27_02280 [Nitrososphaerota archaeon]|nr:hypothetical protein [Nitrososphaerota archaeon]MDG6974911.1 hypothetical protein [Nitrososphaerota archaeon]MDG7009338.1 hypothetical protein [Nitrososphaerota archaeon]MDG7015814.1 hypothetical protein [Nitrososphaerota archaeon]